MNLNLENKYNTVSVNGEEAELTLKELLSFSDRTLLYFYPRDNTPGCTVENKDFSCLKGKFKDL
jgi:thioredoxin-dependent peroxiredoxin